MDPPSYLRLSVSPTLISWSWIFSGRVEVIIILGKIPVVLLLLGNGLVVLHVCLCPVCAESILVRGVIGYSDIITSYIVHCIPEQHFKFPSHSILSVSAISCTVCFELFLPRTAMSWMKKETFLCSWLLGWCPVARVTGPDTIPRIGNCNAVWFLIWWLSRGGVAIFERGGSASMTSGPWLVCGVVLEVSLSPDTDWRTVSPDHRRSDCHLGWSTAR